MKKSSSIDPKTGEVLGSNVVDTGRRVYGRPYLKTMAPVGNDGRTKSEFAKSCDLKERIKVFQERGVLPGMRPPASPLNDVDLTAYPDTYHEALNLVARVGQHFAGLPSEVRTKFHNDPKLYLADMEARQKASAENAAKAAGMAREAVQYDIEGKVASGRQKAAERNKRVEAAMKEPSPPPAKGD